MSKEKIYWIDSLKGLAIISVVVGLIATPLSKFIYAWHIPLFFYVSGLLINEKRSLLEQIKKDFKRLIIPFIVFSSVGLIVEYAKRWLFPSFLFINGSINLKSELVGIFWWMDYSHLRHYGFVLWFLPALFWGKNLLLILKKTLRNNFLISIVSVILLLLSSNQSWVLPFGIDKAFLGLFWIFTARFLTGRFWFLSLLTLFLLPIPETNIALKIINLYGICYSLVAVNTVVGIIKSIPKNIKILTLFGQETMSVLIVHPYINNLAYFLIIYLFKGSWVFEILFVFFVLGVFVYNFKSIKMVFGYIVQNNKPIVVPLKIINSVLVLLFQLLTNVEITKKLKGERKIILFPGCVVSRMFLYADTPDKKEISILRKNMDKDSMFLDIGANVGSYSILLSDITKKIFAFEPSPLSNLRCRKNFVVNGIKESNVKNIALSNVEGEFGFTDFGGTSTVNHLTNSNEAKIKVQTSTLDNWVKDNITISKFNLVMKIDVEGNEEKVILGAKKLFKTKKIKYIVLEVLNNSSKVFKLINSYGYKTGLISGNNYYVEKN